jgi:hypothetical protein
METDSLQVGAKLAHLSANSNCSPKKERIKAKINNAIKG